MNTILIEEKVKNLRNSYLIIFKISSKSNLDDQKSFIFASDAYPKAIPAMILSSSEIGKF